MPCALSYVDVACCYHLIALAKWENLVLLLVLRLIHGSCSSAVAAVVAGIWELMGYTLYNAGVLCKCSWLRYEDDVAPYEVFRIMGM